MQVFHTLGDPPSNGNSNRATSGCTRNNSAALRKSVTVNSSGTAAMGNPHFVGCVERSATHPPSLTRPGRVRCAALHAPYTPGKCKRPTARAVGLFMVILATEHGDRPGGLNGRRRDQRRLQSSKSYR